jgi:bifunctional DNA-binding transcriptional regulator/antitoxin component of YhaV-PrlF toxin-antitoxin module
MLREPAELAINEEGTLQLPMGVLAEAGLSPGQRVLAYSAGDGRIVVRRYEDAIEELTSTGSLT